MLNFYTSSIISSSSTIITASASQRISRRAYELSKIREYFTKRNALSEENAILLDQEWKDLKITADTKKFPFIKGNNKYWLDINLFRTVESKFNLTVLLLAIFLFLIILGIIGLFVLEVFLLLV
ncbi:MAG TPA: hypothetical protein PK957_03840 [Candidatus Dojkabacteria bacterium]|nr:hypothetical protein [Candidatus Dojkabacteria bacterium]HQF36744.1 hypothetical protein [Candidatus Dojkabacteria bacterium]